MLPHTGSTFLDINPILTTLQNQTNPNQTTGKKNGGKKSQKKKRDREMSSYEEKICSLSISRSLCLSHGIQGREDQCMRLQSPAPHPQTETKKTTGEWARFVEIANGKERKNQIWKLNGDPNRTNGSG
jgi:hypothetical protein